MLVDCQAFYKLAPSIDYFQVSVSKTNFLTLIHPMSYRFGSLQPLLIRQTIKPPPPAPQVPVLEFSPPTFVVFYLVSSTSRAETYQILALKKPRVLKASKYWTVSKLIRSLKTAAGIKGSRIRIWKFGIQDVKEDWTGILDVEVFNNIESKQQAQEALDSGGKTTEAWNTITIEDQGLLEAPFGEKIALAVEEPEIGDFPDGRETWRVNGDEVMPEKRELSNGAPRLGIGAGNGWPTNQDLGSLTNRVFGNGDGFFDRMANAVAAGGGGVKKKFKADEDEDEDEIEEVDDKRGREVVAVDKRAGVDQRRGRQVEEVKGKTRGLTGLNNLGK